MSGTIKNEFLRKAGLAASCPEQAIDGSQMPGRGTAGRKHPAVAFCATAYTQKLDDTTAHRHESSSFSGLTVGHKNHTTFPIEILDAHAVELPLVSHSRIAHQDDDVAEKLEGSPSRGAGLSSFKQPPFCFIIKPKMPPMLLHHFDFWSVADHLPLLRFVEHSSQRPQSTVGIGGRARKFQLLGAIACDLVHSQLHNRCRLQQPPNYRSQLQLAIFTALTDFVSWETWSGRESNASRFGICLHPTDPENVEPPPFRSCEYRPAYLPDPLVMDIGEAGIEEPMWVYMSFMKTSSA